MVSDADSYASHVPTLSVDSRQSSVVRIDRSCHRTNLLIDYLVKFVLYLYNVKEQEYGTLEPIPNELGSHSGPPWTIRSHDRNCIYSCTVRAKLGLNPRCNSLRQSHKPEPKSAHPTQPSPITDLDEVNFHVCVVDWLRISGAGADSD
jgi:hypothetical protein